MSNRFVWPFPTILSNAGAPLVGGKLHFYLTGTTTHTPTYTTAALDPLLVNTNPIILDAAGRFPDDIFLDPAITYRARLFTSADVEVGDADPVVDFAANVTAAIQVYAGNPNGLVAGNAGAVGGSGASVVWDITNRLLYICTTTGTTLTAVWTQVASSLAGQVAITGIISPAALAANTNNYAPSGYTTATIYRIDLAGNYNLTGLDGIGSGYIKVIENVSTDNLLTLIDNATSSATKRFQIGVDLVLHPGASASFIYDSTAGRWILYATAGKIVRKETVLTDAATVAWDLADGGPNYKVTLGGDRAFGAFTNGVAGQDGYLRVIQDGTGGRVPTWNAVYKGSGGFIDAPASGVSQETIYRYQVTSATNMKLTLIWSDTGGGLGRALLEKQTIANAAACAFVLTSYLTAYRSFEIEFESVIPATDDQDFRFRTSTDGGSNYDDTLGNYKYASSTVAATSSAPDEDVGANNTSIHLTGTGGSGVGGAVGNGAAEGASGHVRIHDPGNTATRTLFTFQCAHVPAEQTTDFVVSTVGAGIRDAAADVDAIQFSFVAGNITSGFFRLYGIAK